MIEIVAIAIAALVVVGEFIGFDASVRPRANGVKQYVRFGQRDLRQIPKPRND